MTVFKHGITTETPNNLMLGAGAIYMNLRRGANGWEGTPIGATSGGNKFTYKPNFVNIEMDGAMVKVKGLTILQGAEASLEVNVAETSKEVLALALCGHITDQPEHYPGSDTIYVESNDYLIEPNAYLSPDMYLDNIAYVGFRANGDPIIIILNNAVCTSGLDLQGKNGENTVYTLTFECFADLNNDGQDFDTLPVQIYLPHEPGWTKPLD